MLDNPKVGMRAIAAQALGKIGDTRALPKLDSLARSETKPRGSFWGLRTVAEIARRTQNSITLIRSNRHSGEHTQGEHCGCAVFSTYVSCKVARLFARSLLR